MQTLWDKEKTHTHQTTEENHIHHLVLASYKKVKLKFTSPDVVTKELHGRQWDGKEYLQKGIQELFPLLVGETENVWFEALSHPAACQMPFISRSCNINNPEG